MSFPIAILAVLLAGLVVFVVGSPLRAARRGELAGSAADGASESESRREDGAAEDPRRRQDLDAEREAKYREIRDAELDFRTGKLSADDYQAIDSELRAEAIEILDRLEDTEGS